MDAVPFRTKWFSARVCCNARVALAKSFLCVTRIDATIDTDDRCCFAVIPRNGSEPTIWTFVANVRCVNAHKRSRHKRFSPNGDWRARLTTFGGSAEFVCAHFPLIHGSGSR